MAISLDSSSIVNLNRQLAVQYAGENTAVVLAEPQDISSQKWIITEQGTISPVSAPNLYVNDSLEVGEIPYNWRIETSYPGYTIATEDDLLVWVCVCDDVILQRMGGNDYLWVFN